MEDTETDRTSDRKTSAKATRKRQAILDGAAKVLASKGFAGTTLSDVAELAGTQPGSLYYHFESREALVAEVLVNGINDVHQHVRGVVQGLEHSATAGERLEAAIRGHLEFVLVQSAYAKAGVRAIGQVPPEIDQQVAPLRDRYGDYLSELFSAAKREGFIAETVDVSVLRLLVVGAANWAAEWYRPDGRATADALGDTLVGMLFTKPRSVHKTRPDRAVQPR